MLYNPRLKHISNQPQNLLVLNLRIFVGANANGLGTHTEYNLMLFSTRWRHPMRHLIGLTELIYHCL